MKDDWEIFKPIDVTLRRNRQEKLLANEVMVANTAIRNLIRENKTYQIKNILESDGKEGMHPVDQSLKVLLESRKIDLYTALKYAEEKSYFSR